MNKLQRIIPTLVLTICFFNSAAAEQPIDPLDSPSWGVMHKKMLDNGPVVFDDKVSVHVPDLAEDPMNVPVSVKVNGLDDIKQIVVFADLNPIQEILSLRPVDIKPYLSFRIKVEQATPVRAAAMTSDGVWHVGGKWLDAAGGGCTAPSMGRVEGNWYETLMNVSARNWKKGDDLNRLRFRIMHPMDTGLATGIPEFYIEQFDVVDGAGKVLAKLETYQPVSENPVFTLEVNDNVTPPVRLQGADNNGNKLKADIYR